GFAGEYVFADFGEPPDAAGAIYHAPVNATRDGLGTPTALATDAEGPVDVAFGPDGALYYVAHLAGAVRRIASGATPAACATIADGTTQLAAALPSRAFAASPAARRVAKRLDSLEKNVAAMLSRAAGASSKKQHRLYTKARTDLAKLLAMARAANAKGRLGVPLTGVESAVAALVAVVPA